MHALVTLGRLLAAPLLALALIVPAGGTPAFAQGDNSVTQDTALDTLFAELKAAPDAMAAHEIDQRIWMIWTNPADPILAGRMREVLTARQMGDMHGSIVLLDRLVADYPDYAEGWNQRATIRWMLDDLEGSLEDIDKVLALEPRHFGALSGRVMIYLQQGKRPLALREMAHALEVHPFLTERQLFPELQEQEMVHI